MRSHLPFCIIGLISLATRTRCVSDSSNLFSPTALDEGPTDDFLTGGNLDDWTTITPPGDGDLDFSDDFLNADIPLEPDLSGTSPGDEIALNDGGGGSSCAPPLGRRDTAEDSLISCGHQTFYIFSSDHYYES